MNDEEVRAHHPTSLMDENEGCIFLSPMHGRCKEKKIQGKGKDTRQKSKKVRKKQKIVKILAYVKKSSNFIAVKVYKIRRTNYGSIS